MSTSSKVELSTGPMDYVDTGGSGPVVVLLHGLLMDPSLWAKVIDELAPDHRCVAPTLPLGAHTQPMGADADLSMRGISDMVAEFLERLDLTDVTLVGNDTGGVLVQMLMADKNPRVGKAVLVSCDAFDNFPPGMSGKALVLTGKLAPAMFGAFMQQLRLKPMRRLPFTFGWLTKRGDATVASWLKPVLTQSGIRKDTVRVLRSISRNKTVLEDVAESLPSFERPVLILWAQEDRVMPPEHGRRLAELVPNSRLVEVPDSYTLMPLDQPVKLAESLRELTLVAG